MKKRTIKSDFYYSSAMIVAATASGLAQVVAIWHFVGINSSSDPFFTALVAFQTINAVATAARGPIVNRLTPVVDDRSWMNAGRRITLTATLAIAVLTAAAVAIGILVTAASSDTAVLNVATEPLPVHLYMILTAGILATASSCITGQLISRLHFRESALAYIGSAGVTISLTFFLCAFLDAYGASASVLAANLFLIVCLGIILVRYRTAPASSDAEPLTEGVGADRMGRFFYEVGALSAVSGSWQVCILILSAWATRNLEGGATSVFNIGASATGIVTAATAGALAYVLIPHAVEATQKNETAVRQSILIDAIKHPLIVLVPMPVCVVLIASGLADSLTFASTEALTETYLLMLATLGVGSVVQAVATSVSVMALTDRRWAVLLFTGVVTVVATIAGLRAIEPTSIQGGAGVFVFGVAVGTTVLVAFILGTGAFRVLSTVARRLGLVAGLALISGLAGRLIIESAPGSAVAAVAGIAAITVIYLALLMTVMPEYRGLIRGEGLRISES